MSDLRSVPGIGRTFQKGFARIGITRVDQLIGADADELFDQLRTANADVARGLVESSIEFAARAGISPMAITPRPLRFGATSSAVR